MIELRSMRRRAVDESAIATVAAGAAGASKVRASASNPILDTLRANKGNSDAASAAADAAEAAMEAEKRASMARRGRRDSLVDRLRETREKGESKTMLRNEMQGASREDLEYTLQMNEREHLESVSELERLRNENKTLRNRTWQMAVLVEDIQQGNADAYKELAELRKFKEQREEADRESAWKGPGELEWIKLKAQRAEMIERETVAREELARRTAALDEKDAALETMRAEMDERGRAAEAKTAAAVAAMETAMEATAAAEAAAAEATRDRDRQCLLAALRAVSTDRRRWRAKRKNAGGYLWWENADKTLAAQNPDMNDASGLALAMDVSFLVSGMLGVTRNSTSQSHLESHLPPLLRKQPEGRAAEPIVVARPPRGAAWLQSIVGEICADKIIHDRAAERLNEPPVALAPFLLHWANGRFGMQPTCHLTLWTLHQTLVALRQTSIEAATFSLFLELPDTPRTRRVLSFYLHARAHTAGDVQRLAPHVRKVPPAGHGGATNAATTASAAATATLSADSSCATVDILSPTKKLSSSASLGALKGGGGTVSPGGDVASPRAAVGTTSPGIGVGGGSAHEPPRRVIFLSRAWESVHHLFAPAPSHIRLALLRELQNAAAPLRMDVPPPLRATSPMEHHVVEYEFFLLASAVFFDLSTHMGRVAAKASAATHPQPAQQQQQQEQQEQQPTKRKGAGGTLAETPMATALLAVMRRSMILSAPLPDNDIRPTGAKSVAVGRRESAIGLLV